MILTERLEHTFQTEEQSTGCANPVGHLQAAAFQHPPLQSAPKIPAGSKLIPTLSS
jgi:hypothetical protein